MDQKSFLSVKSASFMRVAPCVVANTGNVVLSVGDPNTPKSNSFTTDIGNANVEFDARLGIENLKVIADDYEVTVSQKSIVSLKKAIPTIDHRMPIGSVMPVS